MKTPRHDEYRERETVSVPQGRPTGLRAVIAAFLKARARITPGG